MSVRKPISQKVRFEIFKRDHFTCQYCGSTPPKVVLEVDHILPVSKDGGNDDGNLITSCFNCNRGKGKNELTSIAPSIEQRTIIAAEKEKQYIEFKKLNEKIEKRICNEVNKIEDLYCLFYPTYSLNDTFKFGTIRKFIKALGYTEVYDAMSIACSKNKPANDTTKYFCGICWSKIREVNNG